FGIINQRNLVIYNICASYINSTTINNINFKNIKTPCNNCIVFNNKFKFAQCIGLEKQNNNYTTLLNTLLDSERSEECIDFRMIITSRNNAPISNYGGGFRCKSEYPWCIIGKKLAFSNSFQKNREKQKKITEKREFLRKTSFRPNRFFFFYGCNSKTNH
ncbi:Uncharacterized protein FWK35_00024160, partial [Aphis craccivora]